MCTLFFMLFIWVAEVQNVANSVLFRFMTALSEAAGYILSSPSAFSASANFPDYSQAKYHMHWKFFLDHSFSGVLGGGEFVKFTKLSLSHFLQKIIRFTAKSVSGLHG